MSRDQSISKFIEKKNHKITNTNDCNTYSNVPEVRLGFKDVNMSTS